MSATGFKLSQISAIPTATILGNSTGSDARPSALSASAVRSLLSLVPGTDIQAHDSDLDAIAALTPANDDLIQRKSSAWVNRTIAQVKTDLGFPVDLSGSDATGTLAAARAPAFVGGDVTSSAGSLSLSIAANAVVTAKINDLAVTNAKIADATIAFGKFATSSWSDDTTLASNSAVMLPTQHAVKTYVDAQITGLKFKQDVRVASTANVNISSAPAAIDGITLAASDRVLLKNQTSAAENGVYVFAAASSALTRATDGDSNTELISATFPVREGSVNQDTWWTITNDTITLNTTALVFTQTGGAGTYTNGSGLTLTGNSFSIGSSQVTNAMLAGSIAYSQLSLTGAILNADLAGSIAYSKLSLTGAILNADLAGSIAYSKLSLTGAILNADLAGSIAASKLVGSDIATVGTLTAGTWNATVIGSTYGGTGINNAGRNLTIAANSGTISFSSASLTLTVAAAASVAGTNTGDITIAGQNFLSLTNQVLTANQITFANLDTGAWSDDTTLSGNSATVLPTVHAVKSYVDGAIQGTRVKPSAAYATTAALPTVTYANGTSGVGATLTASSVGTLTIDGQLTALNDLLLIKDQASGLQNGLYKVTTAGTASVAFVLTREISMDVSAEFGGGLVAVETGTSNGGSLFLCTTNAPTVGTTAIVFTELNKGYDLQQGSGISISANTIAVATGGVTNAMLAGSIAYSKLSLTGAILNADLAGSIAYSKLSLTGAILNADLAGSIAASKLVGSDIATVGTITTGTWSATIISTAKGGTGVDNSTGGTANQFWARPNGSTGAAAYRAIVAGDIPTLNQNTTGSAATLTTARLIGGVSFNGSADINPGIPLVSVSAARTFSLSDANQCFLHPAADTTARTWTIDSNANVAMPVGTFITIINEHSAGVLTIAITTDTLRTAGAGTTGSKTLAADAVVTAYKYSTTAWYISGSGMTG